MDVVESLENLPKLFALHPPLTNRRQIQRILVVTIGNYQGLMTEDPKEICETLSQAQ
jgi:hypothetical protein